MHAFRSLRLRPIRLCWLSVLLVGCGCLTSVRLAEAQDQVEEVDPVAAAWQAARQLETEEQFPAAFLKYLTVPGGESAAVKIGRPEARGFLTLLHAQGPTIPAARRRLVEADLLLALRDKAGALAAYRDVASKIATTDQQGWQQGLLPRDEYFVEPPAQAEHWGGQHGVRPFTLGPGSHRDNWLIRRFIALESWDDARGEFNRVWRLHREATQRYAVRFPTFDDKGQATGFQRRIVTPAGFDGRGLQFALDYAFFLQRRSDATASRTVLFEALLLIDMDRNPNQSSWSDPIADTEVRELPVRGINWDRQQRPGGVSRTEFIRLAYGAFKAGGHEAGLVKVLTDRIAAGENRLRRVLAQFRLQQGQADAARLLELDYIKAGKFDPLSTAFRRASAFDADLKAQDAVREFETVLDLLPRETPNAAKPTRWNLPDALESDGYTGQAGGHLAAVFTYMQGDGDPQFNLRATVLGHLERLLTALGQTEKSLNAARQLVLENPWAGHSRSFEDLNRKHRAAKQSEQLLDWAKQQLAVSQDHYVRANLHWLLGDWKSAAASLAKAPRNHESAQWKERFRAAGPEHFRELLMALIAVNPKDAQSQLELLDLDGVTDGPQLVSRLELLLETEAQWAFQRGKGGRNQTQFKDHFDLAYRLMRIYERAGQLDKLHALGVRIARSEKPFGPVDFGQSQYRDSNGIPERANAALGLAIQHADTAEKTESLTAALEKSVWKGARTQLRRRLDALKSEPTTAIVWANQPAGVQLIASTENVLALAHDDRYVYSGHPWGVAVHDLAGQPVIRIALAEAARSLVVIKGHVWVGSPKGLFRIDRTDWSVTHQWLHEDVPVDQRHARSFPGPASEWFDNSVYTLTADGDDLWIGLHRNVQRLNTRTLELRAFSFDELKIEHWAGFEQIVIDDRYVWANSGSGLRRYDRVTDEWSAPGRVGPREPVRFVGIIGGRVFGNVYVDDQLRNRLCLIDRATLGVQVISVAVKKESQLINSPLKFFGKYGERLVFGAEWPAFVLDEATVTLKPIAHVVEQLNERVRARQQAHKGDERLLGALRELDRQAEFTATFGRPNPGDWLVLTLPNGTRVLGGRQGRTRYEYPNEDSPASEASAQHEVKEDEGGLFWVKPSGIGFQPVKEPEKGPEPASQPQKRQAGSLSHSARDLVRVSALPRSNSIRGDLVRQVVFGTDHNWLCTSLGVARLDRENRVQTVFTRADGVCANRVTAGVELLGKTYFSTAWGDSGGGLAVLDPTTKVFTTITQEDGLPTDKLENVQANGERLSLSFGSEYLRHNNSNSETRYRQYPRLDFDPSTHRPGPIGDSKHLTQNEVEGPRQKAVWERAPFLGGALALRLERDGKTYLCGTRGLVILDKEVTVPPFAELGAKLIETITARHLAASDRRPIKIKTPDDLAAALRDENPFYRANAIASLLSLHRTDRVEFLPLLASQLDDKNKQVRATAFYFVTQSADDERVLPLLRARLADSYPQIRVLATVELARRGHVPEISRLQEVLDSAHGNYPFGAKSSIGVLASADNLHAAIAPHATPEIFEWMLKLPPRLTDSDFAQKVFPQLGASLRRHPKAIDVLLKVRDSTSHDHRQRDFARDVLRSVGRDVLPRLHAELKSDDRVIRSNAARACGAIGDASSIQLLIKAAGLESGLSRASIVWALGELKAKAALPVLASLYAEAKADEKRSNGLGFRFGQQAAFVSSQYEQISNLDSLAGEWDELKAASLAPSIDPRLQEELLQTQHILEAVAKIGPEWSMPFYRELAASKDTEARQEAAERLAECPPAIRPENAVVLKSLLTDSVLGIRLRAAVGLILFEEPFGQDVILEALNSPNDWEQRQALEQLGRLPQPDQLSFALARIKAIAKNRLAHSETRSAANNLLGRIPANRQ